MNAKKNKAKIDSETHACDENVMGLGAMMALHIHIMLQNEGSYMISANKRQNSAWL